MQINNINNDFYKCFKLNNKSDIIQYFPENKNNKKDIIYSKLNRIIHFFRTGVWIDKNKNMHVCGEKKPCRSKIK